MLNSLIFSLNVTGPVFLLMLLGLFLHQTGIIDDTFAARLNTFVFKVSLPVLLFQDLSAVDIGSAWDTRFVVYCFAATLISITIAIVISYLLREPDIQGEFIQVSYRSSAALLGLALIQNIYGTTGMGPLMIIGSVPLYNIMAVVVLNLFKPGRKGLSRDQLLGTLKGIITNPIIIGVATGLAASIIKLSLPTILDTTLSNVGRCATPLGLIAMGASFNIHQAISRVKPSIIAAFLKLIGYEALFLPLAVSLGFRKEALIAIMVMLGSASTVSCFVMAKNTGHEGVLTASVVMLTTCISAFTLTGWLFILKMAGLV